MATSTISVIETPLVLYCLRRADDALVLGHRLSEWCGHAPMMEEDMALANIALDLLGQARALYVYAAEVEARDNDEDRYVYLRDVGQYRNLLLVEQPNGDFAKTIIRQFLFSAFAESYWAAMISSADERLAAIARKSAKECAYHLRHTSEWVIRLGDGTDESHARVQAALDDVWPFAGEMFDADSRERALIEVGVAADLRSLKETWSFTVLELLDRALLKVPDVGFVQRGGRAGRHGEHLGRLLAEMQHLQRSHPGAQW